MRSHLRDLLLVTPLLLLAFSGCHPNTPDGLPALYPCRITVVQDGKGLPDAFVSLVPETDANRKSSDANWIPTGTTDEKGVATIYTNGRYVGAPAGRFKVVVEKKEAAESQLGPPPPEESPAYAAWEERWMGETRPLFTLVETQYADPKETPLAVEIKKPNNVFSLDVGEAVKIPVP